MEIRIEKTNNYNEIIGEHEEFTIGMFSKEDWEIFYRRLGHFSGNEIVIKLNVDTKKNLGSEDVIPFATMTIDNKLNPYIITSYDVFDRKILKNRGIDRAYLENSSKELRRLMREILNRNDCDIKIYDSQLNDHIDYKLNKDSDRISYTNPIAVM